MGFALERITVAVGGKNFRRGSHGRHNYGFYANYLVKTDAALYARVDIPHSMHAPFSAFHPSQPMNLQRLACRFALEAGAVCRIPRRPFTVRGESSFALSDAASPRAAGR